MRLFVAALVETICPDAATVGVDGVVAVECTVPMLCVGKRFKNTKEGKIDYIRRGTETLGYCWTEPVWRLYELVQAVT